MTAAKPTCRVSVLGLLLFYPLAGHSDSVRTWRLSVEYHLDSRGYNSLQWFHALASPTFSLVSSLDINADLGQPRRRWEPQDYFLEIDLLLPIAAAKQGWIIELNDFSGPDNDILRAGWFLMPDWTWLGRQRTWLFAKFMPFESDGAGGQVSLAFNQPLYGLWGGCCSLSGYLDWNDAAGRRGNATKVVSDVQFRYNLGKGWHFFTEWHYNQFLSVRDRDGLSIGMKYHF